MGRQMWPYDAERRFTVRATYKQVSAWSTGASIKGLPLPVFLALAADVYAKHLERCAARWKRSDERRKAREAE